MKIINIFHYLSHARWIFFVWAMFLMVQAFLHPGLYALSNTGLCIFLVGLFLGFTGFGDIEKLSKKEIRDFANPKSVKISAIFLLVVAGYIFIQGIYFINIKSIKPAMQEDVAVELKNVGFNCLALGFGFLCYLKLIFDKYKYYQSLHEGKRTCCGAK